ncbi:MAG: B12-binding domain-containing radical SAM protein [Candidatus Hydrogenedens sp.]|nr:B12-binding domain-containing radical SAM protein [Candidatus Hydrogenedens sp.]
MTDILLVSAQPNLDILGLKGLHLYLRQEGFDSLLLYFPVFKKYASRNQHQHIKQLLLEENPKVVGISLTAEDFQVASDITKIVREVLPETYVIWGGIEATTEPERCAQIADFVCIGEGELSLKAFLETVKSGADKDALKKINNLAYIDKEGILQTNPLSPLITDLDILPPLRQIPERSYVDTGTKIEPVRVEHLMRYKRYRGQVYKIMTSRGCPYGCAYCCNRFLRKLYGTWPVRHRGVEHVIQELELAMKEGPPIFYVDIIDDCFFASDMEYIKEFCKVYKKRIGLPFIAKTTAREVSHERMSMLVDAGMTWTNMGLQSGSDRTCIEIYKRPTKSETFLKAAQIVSEYPVGIYYDIILDNPFETLEDRLNTSLILSRTPRPFMPLFFSLRFYPGTELRKRAIEEGILKENPIVYEDYFHWKGTEDNRLIRSACFVSPRIITPLVEKIKKKPHSLILKTIIFGLDIITKTILMPITALRMIYRSQRRSIVGTIKALPVFLNASHLPTIQHLRRVLKLEE